MGLLSAYTGTSPINRCCTKPLKIETNQQDEVLATSQFDADCDDDWDADWDDDCNADCNDDRDADCDDDCDADCNDDRDADWDDDCNADCNDDRDADCDDDCDADCDDDCADCQTWEVISQLSVKWSIRFAVVDLLTWGLATS